MSKPSVGYKDIPLLWIDMVDVSKMIGFILPDWIADILPGEYPVHTKDGIVKQNFKGNVLKFVTGDFKLFKDTCSLWTYLGLLYESFTRTSFWNNYWCSIRIIHGIKQICKRLF